MAQSGRLRVARRASGRRDLAGDHKGIGRIKQTPTPMDRYAGVATSKTLKPLVMSKPGPLRTNQQFAGLRRRKSAAVEGSGLPQNEVIKMKGQFRERLEKRWQRD